MTKNITFTANDVSLMLAILTSVDEKKYVSLSSQGLILKCKGFRQSLGHDENYTVTIVPS